MYKNRVIFEFEAKSENERFARTAAAAFVLVLDPLTCEIEDMKTAVSEAVTNSIVHGYDGKGGTVRLSCEIEDRLVTLTVEDFGVGIEDIGRAREPMFTTKPEKDRSGMGFTFMEFFMDSVEIYSKAGEGTKVVMKKRFAYE